MIFKRTYRYNSPLQAEDIRQRLIGKHIQVHHLDFEILEREKMLKIIPHAEDTNAVKTLPITHVEMQGAGSSGTKITLTSKPRRIDIGGPYLIVIFCLFCIVGASVLYLMNPLGKPVAFYYHDRNRPADLYRVLATHGSRVFRLYPQDQRLRKTFCKIRSCC